MVEVARPQRIYNVKKFYFFAFDGFIMYSEECKRNDFTAHNIIDAIEFANVAWQKR
jgi:hypothetical protein